MSPGGMKPPGTKGTASCYRKTTVSRASKLQLQILFRHSVLMAWVKLVKHRESQFTSVSRRHKLPAGFVLPKDGDSLASWL